MEMYVITQSTNLHVYSCFFWYFRIWWHSVCIFPSSIMATRFN